MDTRETIPEAAGNIGDQLRYHGGDINAAQRRFPNAPSPWIDLSTGINPFPYPVGAISSFAWTRLPDPSEIAALEASARIAYGAGSQTEIIAAPGTQALIQWLPRLVPARRVGILGFTYEEHRRSWLASGAEVETVAGPSDLAAFDAAIVVNPNNPDGRIVPPDILIDTAEIMARRGGVLIVDEAFMDVLGKQHSLIPKLPGRGAVVLRSFGKTYGLAGLRLGFAVASSELAGTIRDALGPWPVSGPAIEIGCGALADESWLAATTGHLRDEANRLDDMLGAVGFQIVGGTPLFRLVRHPHAAQWFERLGRAGILTRPFSRNAEWLRFGVPAGPAEWRRLEAALFNAR
jgi:cobalamin biosynthetic protein CobC